MNYVLFEKAGLLLKRRVSAPDFVVYKIRAVNAWLPRLDPGISSLASFFSNLLGCTHANEGDT